MKAIKLSAPMIFITMLAGCQLPESTTLDSLDGSHSYGKILVHSRGNAAGSSITEAKINIVQVQIRGKSGKYLVFTDQNFELKLTQLDSAFGSILAKAQVPDGSYDQIRLITADTGNVTLSDGTQHELKVPSGPQTGIKVFLDTPVEVSHGKIALVALEFDLSHSFVAKGNGTFNFKPVVRVTDRVIDDPNPDGSTENPDTVGAGAEPDTGTGTGTGTDTGTGTGTDRSWHWHWHRHWHRHWYRHRHRLRLRQPHRFPGDRNLMKPALSTPLFLLALFTALAAPPAGAAGSGEATHLISAGAGIASPSLTSALTENPAGLSYNQGFRLLGAGSTQNSDPGISQLGLGAYFGNGTLGGAIQLDSDMSSGASGQSFSNRSNLSLGFAADVKSLNTSLGLSCGAALGSSFSLSCSDFGAIYNPTGTTRVGVELITSGTPTLIGAGIATDASKDVTLALDAGADWNGNGLGLKPGVVVRASSLQLAAGYGFSLDNGATSFITKDISVGLGLDAGKSFHVQAYYNQLAKFYLGAALKF